MARHPGWETGVFSKGDIASRKKSLQEMAEVGVGIEGKSGGVEGELASDP